MNLESFASVFLSFLIIDDMNRADVSCCSAWSRWGAKSRKNEADESEPKVRKKGGVLLCLVTLVGEKSKERGGQRCRLHDKQRVARVGNILGGLKSFTAHKS